MGKEGGQCCLPHLLGQGLGNWVSCPLPPQAGRQGNKSALGSRCLALLGQLKRVTYEEVEAANTCLDRTKPISEIKAPFGHLMLVLEHTLDPKNRFPATCKRA